MDSAQSGPLPVAAATAPEVRSGLVSLRALARGLYGLLLGACALLLATGDALALALAPMLLAVAAMACGVGVFLLNPAPKARWRGMGASAILTGLVVVLIQVGVVP